MTQKTNKRKCGFYQEGDGFYADIGEYEHGRQIYLQGAKNLDQALDAANNYIERHEETLKEQLNMPCIDLVQIHEVKSGKSDIVWDFINGNFDYLKKG